MSSRSKHKAMLAPKVEPIPHTLDIEAGMKRVKDIADAVKRGYDKGYEEGCEHGRTEATNFTTYTMCAALGLAMNDLYGFGKKRVTRTLNLAAKYMLESFTTREIMEEVYKRIGFEFVDDPVSGNLVEEIE